MLKISLKSFISVKHNFRDIIECKCVFSHFISSGVFFFQRSQSAPHIKNAELLFGDSFDGGRPSWCVLMKMAQGLGDALFRHKFHDWKTSTVRLSNRWEMRPPKRDMLNVMEEEAMAVELGR